MNTIASLNFFATLKVAFWCRGTFLAAQALGCGTFWSPLELDSGSAWVDGARSDSDELLRRVDFWRLSSGGAIAPAGFQEFGSGGRAITLSAPPCFIGSGTLVVCNDWSHRACPRSRTSCL